jgi:hypothetical protein
MILDVSQTMRRALRPVLIAACLAGCDPTRVCSPGTTQICACGGGAQGVQTCDPAGQSWGACQSCLAPDATIKVEGLVFPDRGPDLRIDARPPDACKPQCTKLECGPDGCGGSCGQCSLTGTVCVAGHCQITALSFTATLIPPFGRTLPPSWLYQVGKAGHTITCTVSGSSLRIKTSDGTTSFQIESNVFNPSVCSLHQVTDFSAALLKANNLVSYGFLPPLQPAGVGKYPLNFDLTCKLVDNVLSGTFFFTVLYWGNQDGTSYIDVSKGNLVCPVTAP